MKIFSLCICLLSGAVLLSGCEGFDHSEQEGPAKITRIFLPDSAENPNGSEAVLDYHYIYDNQNRVTRVAIEMNNSNEGGTNSPNVSEDYLYSYVDFDSIAILRQVLQYGGESVGGSSESHHLSVSIDDNRRILSMEDSSSGIRMEYTYDADFRLNGLTKYWTRDSSLESFHLDIGWTKDGNIETILSGNFTYSFEYGDAPLVNRMNIDLLGWLLEREFMENIPLWSIGLQGQTNRNMPSALSIGIGNASVRIHDYSYTAQNGYITSFTVTDSHSGHKDTYSIETAVNYSEE